MSEPFQAYWDRESNVKEIVKHVLQKIGYQVTKREYALPIEGGYRRYPDVYAKMAEKVIVVECKGGSIKRRFYHVVNALGQVLVVKAHYPKFEVAIAVPERWGKDCLSDTIRERYDVRLWLVFTSQRTILNADEGEFLE